MHKTQNKQMTHSVLETMVKYFTNQIEIIPTKGLTVKILSGANQSWYKKFNDSTKSGQVFMKNNSRKLFVKNSSTNNIHLSKVKVLDFAGLWIEFRPNLWVSVTDIFAFKQWICKLHFSKRIGIGPMTPLYWLWMKTDC